ncbi:hypothetical protein ACQQ2N_12265 [Dokdonella sp. MW10]|uniref:hypothetical protein n=1 Tax=Dokdonella sp. MW10 TaxID=2992926 RepID=UPI003F811483
MGAARVLRDFVVGMLGMVALIVVVVWACWTFLMDHEPPPAPAPVVEEPMTPERRAGMMITAAKMLIPKHLKDPDSARFRNLVAVNGPDDIIIVCGEVNSKNSFGALAGFSRFIFAEVLTVMEDNSPADAFRKAWNSRCAGKPPLASSPT